MKRACLAIQTLLLVMLLSLATGCATDKKVISQANESNKQLEPAIITDRALQGYVQSIGDRVTRVAREMSDQGFGPKAHKQSESDWMFKNIQFHLVNSKTLNAFTTGGTHVYLYSELFTLSKSEDEFAAVVAHEFAHIYCRHVQKGMNRQMTILGAAAVAGVAGAVIAKDNRAEIGLGAAGLTYAGGQFLGMGFTRDDEDEADKIGFEFYCRAGWDPYRFPDFFRQMIEKGYDKTPEALSDHPKLANRVKNTEDRVKKLPPIASQWRKPNLVSQAEFLNLQDHARRVGKNTPSDKSLEAAQLMLAAFPSCVAPTDLPEQKQAQSRILKAMGK